MVGVVSSLITVMVMFALLTGSAAVMAQQGAPPPGPVDENTADIATAETGDANDANAGAPERQAVLEEDAPDATTEYIHIAGSAFVPMHSDSGVGYTPWGCMYMSGPSHSSNFAVVLPYGSTVTYLRLYYYDSSATNNGTMQFAEYDDGAGSYLDTLQTAGSSGAGTVTHSGLNLPIDYVNFIYVFLWDVAAAAGSQVRLCGMRIGFTPPIGRINLLPSTLYNAHP